MITAVVGPKSVSSWRRRRRGRSVLLIVGGGTFLPSPSTFKKPLSTIS
jgi:hypothetical protein